jgi:hypothetical protein
MIICDPRFDYGTSRINVYCFATRPTLMVQHLGTKALDLYYICTDLPPDTLPLLPVKIEPLLPGFSLGRILMEHK